MCAVQLITAIIVMDRMVKNSQDGFTLLELMIVLSVTAMLTIGALSSYRNFSQTRSLEADTEAFLETLELAKKNTNSGQKPCNSYTGNHRVSWGNTSFTLTPLGCADTAQYVLKANQFVTAPSSIDFNPFGRGTSLTSDVCVLLKNIYLNQCRKITIEQAGTVSQDINVACSCSS